MIFKGKRSEKIHNFTIDVDPGYKYIKKISGGVQWYMMESKDIISSSFFKLKNEKGELVSFNGQSNFFRLSINEIQEMDTHKYMSIYTTVYLRLFEYLY